MEENLTELIESHFTSLNERISEESVRRKKDNQQIDEALKDDVPELKTLVTKLEQARTKANGELKTDINSQFQIGKTAIKSEATERN